jgi:hypothetical protein
MDSLSKNRKGPKKMPLVLCTNIARNNSNQIYNLCHYESIRIISNCGIRIPLHVILRPGHKQEANTNLGKTQQKQLQVVDGRLVPNVPVPVVDVKKLFFFIITEAPDE